MIVVGTLDAGGKLVLGVVVVVLGFFLRNTHDMRGRMVCDGAQDMPTSLPDVRQVIYFTFVADPPPRCFLPIDTPGLGARDVVACNKRKPATSDRCAGGYWSGGTTPRVTSVH